MRTNLYLSLQMMVFAVLLQFVWMVVTMIISVAVLYLLLIQRMSDNGAKVINLKHYGKPNQSCALNKTYLCCVVPQYGTVGRLLCATIAYFTFTEQAHFRSRDNDQSINQSIMSLITG